LLIFQNRVPSVSFANLESVRFAGGDDEFIRSVMASLRKISAKQAGLIGSEEMRSSFADPTDQLKIQTLNARYCWERPS
jgi:hypothetical protein